jgi:alginate O-acetyltransferase complex protein AlgI
MMHEIFSQIASLLPSTDFYVDLPFWGYFAAAVLVYRLTPPRAWLKPWLLLTCSACMLLALPRFNPSMLAVMAGLCAITYGCGRLLLRGEEEGGVRARSVVAGAGIAAILLVLVFFKYGSVQQAILRRQSASALEAAHLIVLIGISYSSFKAMHFVVEAYKRTIKNPTFVAFLNYVLFFPSFISGPINRYNHFYEQSAEARNSTLRSDLAAGLERIVHGLFKKTVLTMVLLPYTLKNMGTPIQEMSLWQVALGLYAYALYFYFDFSGYTDLAIGSARIMGFVLPENFDLPFLKKNIQQLWANWHISLTSWLTDYVYWPLVRKLRSGEHFRKRPVLVSNIAIVVTFVICGIWHGDTPSFLLWGLYHGLGIAAVNIYQNWKRKVRHPAARAYFVSSYSRVIGTVVTFNFFAVGLLPFVLDLQQIRMLLGRLV